MRNDEKKNGSGWLRRLLVEHPAFLFSALYLAASVVGMGFSWDFLRRFGINVFYFAELSDFMLASLKEPYTWGLVLFAVLIVAGDNALSKWVAKKGPGRWLAWYASRKYRVMNYVVALVLCVVFIDAYASIKARDVHAGKGSMVTVALADGTPPGDYLLLGTTGRYLFLFQRKNGQVTIHPAESVLTILVH